MKPLTSFPYKVTMNGFPRGAWKFLVCELGIEDSRYVDRWHGDGEIDFYFLYEEDMTAFKLKFVL